MYWYAARIFRFEKHCGNHGLQFLSKIWHGDDFLSFLGWKLMNGECLLQAAAIFPCTFPIHFLANTPFLFSKIDCSANSSENSKARWIISDNLMLRHFTCFIKSKSIFVAKICVSFSRFFFFTFIIHLVSRSKRRQSWVRVLVVDCFLHRLGHRLGIPHQKGVRGLVLMFAMLGTAFGTFAYYPTQTHRSSPDWRT